ncbi:hypothetical protein HHK36_026420 [Tetracentron sinense]|uniref:Programmed cell death protein 2 C-terminal domain-containing protein n=1 Tax=Tetracentron sinense TaxID=13715 RepID=A0A834YJM1_TETSI|nr:hypothetical protein HHK36_026420 [Tetracentron sinense]
MSTKKNYSYFIAVPSNSLWPEFEIIIEDECAFDSEVSEDNAYASALVSKEQMDETVKSLLDNFEGDSDKRSWASFQERIAKAPEQVLRYCRDANAKPLWPVSSGRSSEADIPKCKYCDGPLGFEFQILPQLLYYFGVKNDADSLDWATIVVYTCAASCEASVGYKDEFAWVQLSSPSAVDPTSVARSHVSDLSLKTTYLKPTMASSHWGEMKEKNSNTTINNSSCRALFRTPSRAPPKSPLSHFINITIKKSTSLNHSSTNIRIKIPKLLGKTLKKKDSQSNHVDTNKNNIIKNSKKWGNPRKLFPTKVSSLFANVFSKKSSVNGGNDRSRGGSSSGDGTRNVRGNLDGHGNRCTGSSMRSTNSLNGVELPSECHTLNEILKVEEEEEKLKKQTGLARNNTQQSIVTHKPPRKLSLSFWRFFKKKIRLDFIKGKSSISSSSNGGGGGGASDSEIEKEEVVNGKARSLRNKAAKVVEDKEEGDKELCRKRILMGERCRRRMDFSGLIRYDENGNPLP